MGVERRVIDTDVHLQISNDRLARELEEPHRTRLQRSDPFLSMGWDRLLSGKIERRSASTPEEIEAQLCDGLGVDVPILNPTLKLPRVPQKTLAAELMTANNNVLIDDFLDRNNNFYGLACVSPRNPERSAEEIDRVASERGIVGAFVATSGTSPPMGDPSYDILYDAIESNGLVVAYHAAAGSFIQDFPIQSRAIERFMVAHPLSHLWAQTLTLATVLANGIPEKFPDIDHVFLEAGGVSWIPMMMFRLNKEYAIRRSEAPLLERSPEEYMRESFYFSTQPFDEPNDPTDLHKVLKIIGPETLMFSSDYPHWDFDDLSAVETHIETAFGRESSRKVLSKNAEEVFGIRYRG